ncbi:MAG: lytic murein transglycosylase B [Cyclobacteriaceae bacterium]|nr:lytic murein transglycosylase B [Cyclobacteriaceae bacterium HetDA_MAG_MS6]
MFKWCFISIQLLILFPLQAQVNEQAVKQFIADFSSKHQVDKTELTRILSTASYQESIIKKMTKPAEKMPWHRYRRIFMTEERIQSGVAFWQDHLQTLQEVSDVTGVPAEVIVGIIGVETFYGERKGTHKILDALYTLAFAYPKRAKFFKSELEQFLLLSEEEDIEPTEALGSYAGAIGYCQFMPSSYRAYAKSFEKNGTKDLIGSPQDAIASVANYLKVHRWKTGQQIVSKAKVDPNAEPTGRQSLRPKYTLSHFQKMGYSASDISSDRKVTLIQLDLEDDQEYWFGLDNFYVITRYNHSALYAMAVYQLATAIKARI